MKINLSNAKLEKIAVKKDDYPPIKMPEMCICGRSNVGKSSFINTIFKDKLAKVGSTPGKTRTINFSILITSSELLTFPAMVTLRFQKRRRKDGRI